MFSLETVQESTRLEQEWHKRVAQVYGEPFVGNTASGIRLKPVYTPGDVTELDFGQIGVPGEYPYARGIYPLQYQFQPWMNQQNLGYGLPEHTRERMEALWNSGMAGYVGTRVCNLSHDLVCKAGLDPDDPEAAGLVGQGGVSLCTLDDFERLFHDLNLEELHLVQQLDSSHMAGLALYVAYAETRGFARHKLNGNSMNFLYRGPYVDCAMFPPRSAFILMVEFIRFCTEDMPRWNTTNFHGYGVEEAGANAIQELAFTLSAALALTEECVKAGLNPDRFLPRFSFQFAQGNDFFEEIAKIRAARRMWAKITRERFGCQNQRAMQMRLHIHTSGSSLIAQQPLVNVVRATIHTLGAVLSGSNSISTSAYDEALGIPTEEAATLALRTQQVILHETNIASVSDPLAGSYYLEWLTSKIEDETFKLIESMEENGGYAKLWETGWFKQELNRSAYRWKDSVDKGEKVIVGLNKYVTEETQRVPVFRVDPEIEQIAKERVRKYRQNRNEADTRKALSLLRQEADKVKEGGPGRGELMPAMIRAALSRATLGEMQAILREVYGWGYAY